MERSLFMLGTHPTLSLAELWALSGRFGQPWQPTNVDPAFIILPWREGPSHNVFDASAGIVRMGIVFAEGGKAADPIPAIVARLRQRAGRVIFGLSALGKGGMDLHEVQSMGLTVKEQLIEAGRSVRFVFGREPILSAASVSKNHLMNRGMEVVFARQGNAWWLAETVAIQPFEDYARRDMGRPSRDLKSGTLPPKLARLLINLSRTPMNGVLLDPFLGSGTIIQEATILGYKQLVGSDVAASAVEKAVQNLAWLERKRGLKRVFRTVVAAAESLPGKILAQSIDGIATEPYLGPALNRDAGPARREALIAELGQRYIDALASFARILKSGGRVAMVFPVFARRDSQGFLPILDHVTQLGFRVTDPLPPEILARFKPELSFRNSLLYHREGQHVWREILLLEKR